ncbi:MAG TPA: hypothetical protein VGI46_06840 [Candidatus Acidoferrum sp.]|jgi:hypothetical protein
MPNLNPMNLNTTGAWPGNPQQSDYRVPGVNAAVASYPVGSDVLKATPVATPYLQPNLSTKDDPQGTIRAGRSGR